MYVRTCTYILCVVCCGKNGPLAYVQFLSVLPVLSVCLCVCLCVQIHWHDFAFYDPVMYDSLRQLIVEAQQPSGAQHLEALQLTFQVQLRDEEGGGIHDLCINGGGRPVTPENVFEYVQQYTLLRMVNWCEPMLKVSMRTLPLMMGRVLSVSMYVCVYVCVYAHTYVWYVHICLGSAHSRGKQ